MTHPLRSSPITGQLGPHRVRPSHRYLYPSPADAAGRHIAQFPPPWHTQPMPRKPTITEVTLRSLGPKRLAALVLEGCQRDDVLEKKVRMMLAAKGGGGALDAELTTRIKSLRTGRSFVDWRQAGNLAETIDAIRASVTGDLAGKSPRAAVARLWELIDASDSIMERADDSGGSISGSLRGAVADLGAVLAKAGVDDPDLLAKKVHASTLDNGYGVTDGLVRAVAPALGPKGREALRAYFERDIATTNTTASPTSERERDYDRDSRRFAAASGLMDLADAESNVDAFLRAAELSPYKMAHIDEAAKRLLKTKRPAEALAWLDRLPPDHFKWRDATGDGVIGIKLRALDALGRHHEAQALRWQVFERYLSSIYLREHVKRLPDFEDESVIRKAIAHAMAHQSVLDALSFLVAWPNLEAAARLVTTRSAEIDGRQYELLNPAIDRLEEKHPIAATILLRAKIDSVLARASSTQYGHAARDLARAATLAPMIEAGGTIPTHAAYFADLKVKHARKTSFWPKVVQAGVAT
jgi:hypothetical protein